MAGAVLHERATGARRGRHARHNAFFTVSGTHARPPVPPEESP